MHFTIIIGTSQAVENNIITLSTYSINLLYLSRKLAQGTAG